MKFPNPLVAATLIRRYKRFLADVELVGGERLTVHCPNTGSMLGCAEPGSRVWLAHSDNPKRKYAYSWQLVEADPGQLTCIYSAGANNLVKEALAAGRIAELADYPELASEVRYGQENSRIDFLLSGKEQRCFVEVKSVTLHAGEGLGLFPDAVSSRGARHLRELQAMVAAGDRGVLLFLAQSTAITRIAPAWEIDRRYAEALRDALAGGVEVICYGCEISPAEIRLTEPLAFSLADPDS